MSGHSKWANIKHKKGAADKKKGKIFSRLAKEIMVAARQGGGEADANPRLRTALTAAKSANMPNINIERAINKGTGELEGEALEEMAYEGYGAGGVAILVECLSDNRNRSGGDVRMLFDRNNGNLAAAGAVTWMFHRKAQFIVAGENADEEALLELLIDAGVESIEVEDDIAEILGPPEMFENISKALEEANITTEEAGLIQHPENTTNVDDPNIAIQVLRLIEKLEDLEDVQAVHSNIDIPPDVMEIVSQEE
jgi:YebC/PmpR family DNA-binding regulatory protein